METNSRGARRVHACRLRSGRLERLTEDFTRGREASVKLTEEHRPEIQDFLFAMPGAGISAARVELTAGDVIVLCSPRPNYKVHDPDLAMPADAITRVLAETSHGSHEGSYSHQRNNPIAAIVLQCHAE